MSRNFESERLADFPTSPNINFSRLKDLIHTRQRKCEDLSNDVQKV